MSTFEKLSASEQYTLGYIIMHTRRLTDGVSVESIMMDSYYDRDEVRQALRGLELIGWTQVVSNGVYDVAILGDKNPLIAKSVQSEVDAS